MQFIRNTILFYLFIHAVVSVFSLLICFEDIDHFNIQCPRMAPWFKQLAQDQYRVFLPQLMDYYAGKLLELDLWIVNTLVFSGIVTLVSASIAAFYYILVKVPILQKLVKVMLILGLLGWLFIQFTGVGIRTLIEVTKQIYHNPDYDYHYEQFQRHMSERIEELNDYYL